LVTLPEADRDSRIAEFVVDHFNAEKARDALRQFEQETVALRDLGNFGLFWMFFVLIPIVYWAVGGKAPFFAMLGAGWALMAAGAVLFFRTHRRLAPMRVTERWQHAILCGLIPQHALRTSEIFARDCLATFHPLAVAIAVQKQDQVRDFAARVWRDAVHPLPLEADPTAVAAAGEFHEKFYLPALEAAIIHAGFDPADLLVPSESDTLAEGYCPRCHTGFAKIDAPCQDCGGLACTPRRER
jgi:hypothetical protein